MRKKVIAAGISHLMKTKEMRQYKLKSFCKLLLLFVLSFSIQTFGQQINQVVSSEESITESVKLAPCTEKDRIEAVKKLFTQMGAKDDEITVKKFHKDTISNVVVRKKGKSDETIVIGAHYDKTNDGCGATDYTNSI